jgi:hypothetical protein
VQMKDHEAIRRDLRRRAGSKRTRGSEFTPEAPCKWQPTQVIDPRSQEPFTDAGAWDFICDLLDGGCEIEEIDLQRPPGRKGYVLTTEGVENQIIYVKLQLTGDKVLGRSFHYSKPDSE